MQLQYKFNKNDEYYTPSYAVYPIMEKYLKEALFGVHLIKKVVIL